jgi:hypothetical protein
MRKSACIAPPNSSILVMDRTGGEIPRWMNGAIVSSTSSCVAVGTLSQSDGGTTLTLTNERPAIATGLFPVLDGDMDTPSRILSVVTCNNVELLSLDVNSQSTRVEVWVNDDKEPDQIYIIADAE